MKKLGILIAFTIFPFSNTYSQNYDGLWLLAKEETRAACASRFLDAGDAQNDDSLSDLVEGFALITCETVLSFFPLLDIKNDRFDYSFWGLSGTCSVDSTTDTVTCSQDEDNWSKGDDLYGDLSFHEGLLLWKANQGESKSMQLFYRKRI